MYMVRTLSCIHSTCVDESSNIIHCAYRQGQPHSTFHLLNGCSSALRQRPCHYKWRHNSVLLSILSGLKSCFPPDCKVFTCTGGLKITLRPPPSVLSSPLRPVMIAIWPYRKSINLLNLELTVPANSTDGFNMAHSWKQLKQRYLSLVGNLGWKVHYDIVEIGSLVCL